MAMHSSRLTRDQNFSVCIDEVNSNGSTVQKNKRDLRGMKALHDISNIGKPSALQPSQKHNTRKVLPIGEDHGVSRKPQIPVGSRKPLGDITNNSVLPSSSQMQGLKKNSKGKQSIAYAEDENLPYTIADQEGFLHNHDECIKSQKKSMGLDEFLKIVGLDEGGCFQSVSACSNPPSKSKDEIPLISEQDRPCGGLISPICGSPNSPKLPYMMYMKDYDFPRFFLRDSP